MHEDISYCGALVKEYDPDRFLLCMFASADVREDLWALFSFNYEIAKTREVVSDTTLGQIRLQWWRDAIASIYDGEEVTEHEIVQPLARAIHAHDLPQEHFETLLHAREFDLEDVAPETLEGLLIYIDHTNAPLLKLALQICGHDPEVQPVQAMAVNYGLMGVLRSAQVMAAQGRCLLPSDLMAKHGVSKAALYQGKPEEGIALLAQEICEGYVHGIKVDRGFLRAYLSLSGVYYSQVKSLKYNIFAPRMECPPSFRALSLVIRNCFI